MRAPFFFNTVPLNFHTYQVALSVHVRFHLFWFTPLALSRHGRRRCKLYRCVDKLVDFRGRCFSAQLTLYVFTQEAGSGLCTRMLCFSNHTANPSLLNTVMQKTRQPLSSRCTRETCFDIHHSHAQPTTSTHSLALRWNLSHACMLLTE